MQIGEILCRHNLLELVIITAYCHERKIMGFYGRKEILSQLDDLWGKNGSSLVTCRGRRRIGKSTLIEHFAEVSSARYI